MNWATENAETKSRDGVDRPYQDPDSILTSLVFLGTGAACGVPTYYCNCKACREAELRPEARRTCSSIAIMRSQTTLIDTAPEIHQQLHREKIMDIDRVLFTHEHFDHVGGVPQLEYYSRLRSKKPLEFYCNTQTASYLKTHFAFMSDVFSLNKCLVGEVMEFDGISYTPISASHCPGALGYLIEVPAKFSHSSNGSKVAYLPDTSRPPQETLDVIAGADILIIDATFNTGNWMPTQHLDIDSALALGEELEVKRTYLTHLSMQFDVPITLEELDAKLLDAKLDKSTAIASRDGMRLEL